METPYPNPTVSAPGAIAKQDAPQPKLAHVVKAERAGNFIEVSYQDAEGKSYCVDFHVRSSGTEGEPDTIDVLIETTRKMERLLGVRAPLDGDLEKIITETPLSVAEYYRRRWPRKLGYRSDTLMEQQWGSSSEYLIDGVIPDSAVTVIYGWPGQAKSAIVLSIMNALTDTAEWMGRKVNSSLRQGWEEEAAQVCKAVITEGHHGYGRRIKAVTDGMEFIPGVLFKKRKINLLNYEALCAEVPQHGCSFGFGADVRVLVIDTARDCIPGGYETYANVEAALTNLKQLAMENSVTVILVAHASDKSRGTTVTGTDGWLQHPDASWIVQDGVMTCRKMRDADLADIEPVRFGKLKRHGSFTVAASDAVPAAAPGVAPGVAPGDAEAFEKLAQAHCADSYAAKKLLGPDAPSILVRLAEAGRITVAGQGKGKPKLLSYG